MAIWNLYSKRKRAVEQPFNDVFVYDKLPNKLRVQIIHILSDAFGNPTAYNSETKQIWRELHMGLAREYGVFSLSQSRVSDMEAVGQYFLETNLMDEALDIIHLCGRNLSDSGFQELV